MMRPLITLFAGSGTPNDPEIIKAAEQAGHALAKAGFDLIYGGGTEGVMGAAAAAALAAGSKITAVLPEIYRDWPQLEGAETRYVETEQLRFQHLMAVDPAFCVVLPGGPGSLREAMQALEAGVYADGVPVILIRVKSYLDGVKNYFDQAVTTGLIKADRKDKLLMMTPEELTEFLARPATQPAAPVPQP